MLLHARHLIFASLMALGAAGCEGDPAADDETDDSAITASEANARQSALKEHVLAGVPASAESARALGIRKWDVFAGMDVAKKFSGAVFYASDADNDVRYAFVVNTETNEAGFIMLAKDGTQLKDPKIDAETYATLLNDVVMLKTKHEALKNKKSSGGVVSGTFDCALIVAGAALAIITGGAVLGAGAVGVAYLGSSLFYAGAASAGLGEVIILLLGTSAIGYGEYFVLSHLLSPVVSAPARCVSAITGNQG